MMSWNYLPPLSGKPHVTFILISNFFCWCGSTTFPPTHGNAAANLSANFVFPPPEDRGLHDDEVPELNVQNSTQSRNHSAAYFAVAPRPPECTKTKECAQISSNLTEYLDSINVMLSYRETARSLDEEKAFRFLEIALRLRYHKRCWDTVQPLIFALAVPKCADGRKRLIPEATCLKVHEDCGSWVVNHLPDELEELKVCDDRNDYSRQDLCKDQVGWFDKLETNLTFVCPHPMVSTADDAKIRSEVDNPNGNCALRCHNAFFSEAQQESLHIYIAVLVALGFFFNGSALISLAVRWRELTKYPDKCLFFINICFLMGGIGWAIQFVPGARDIITCSEDNTERIHEPKHGESYGLCLTTFLLIYYFMFAAAIWFVSMTYCWYRSFRAIFTNEVKASGVLKNYSIRFHVAAWGTPLLMSLIVIATSGIDGNNISGICFIGLEWGYTRGFLLVMPLLLVAVVSGFFMTRGLIVLYRIKKTKEDTLSADDKHNIRKTMLHIGFIAGLVCICIFISIAIHAHYYLNFSYYRMLRIEFIDCHLKKIISGVGECHQRGMLDYETVELGVHLGLQFVAGIIFSSWVWRRSHWKKRVKDLRRKVRTLTQRASTTATPQGIFSGSDNASFVPDVPRTEPQTEIAVSSPTVSQYMYDAVDGLPPSPVRSRNPSGNPTSPGSDAPEDSRLENWQERAREARLEKRKKSSTAKPPGAPATPPIDFLHSISLPESTVIVMEPSPSANPSRKRKPGRVEYFRQGRSKVPSDPALLDSSDTGSSTEMVELSDFSAATSSSNLILPVPKRGILKNNNSIADGGVRDSPDEGIEIGRPGTASRESVFSIDSNDDRVHLQEKVDASEA